MSKPSLNDVIALIPELNLNELRALEASISVAVRIRSQSNLSTDSPFTSDEENDVSDQGPSLNDWAEDILRKQDQFPLTLADQGLLAALILSEVYNQDSFSSRDINNVIKEFGRPAVANITSAIGGLRDRSFLVGNDNKNLSLSNEGKRKARALIGAARREHSEAA